MTTGTHAAGSTPIGQPTAAALVTRYATTINTGRGDDLNSLLCGDTGSVADTAPMWSWAFLALREQVQPTPVTTTSDGATSTLTISYQGTKSGLYGLIMRQHAGRWCVEAVNNGSLGMAGLSTSGN